MSAFARMISLMSCLALAGLIADSAAGQDALPAADILPQPVKKPADLKFKVESFTFVRIKYAEEAAGRRRSSWATDYPDSDLNLAARLTKDTGLASDHSGKVLTITDPQLPKYPFIYLVEPGQMQLSDEEARSLRAYLLGGGFLMVDDFWGEAEWEHFASELKKAFPDREPKELPLSHPVFHAFYRLDHKPQVPSIHAAYSGLTSERLDGTEVHYRGLTDDRGRLMAIICHNTDLGDGWEREGTDARYTREYSEKRAYPMGINILVYALTQTAEVKK